MRYSPLDQINRSNVKDLRVAWIYRSGDPVSENKTTIECTPIIVQGVMYVTTPFCKVAALDPATGREIWKYDPYRAVRRPSNAVNRGVAYWSDGRAGGARRVLMGTSEGRLISLDARTGQPDQAFGSSGEVDLRAGIERDLTGMAYGVTSPPAIFKDIVLLGFYCGEGPPPSSPGDMRAFDVRTGKELWRFHTVPRPGEFGSDTWEEDSWKDRGGANAWGGLSVDVKRGWVFGGLGSAGFDFYGGDRKGQNLFANSVLALDAQTGKRVWHFQVVRHDLWDYDLPVYPNLVTVQRDGKPREAVAQVTKTGYVFLLDRETGKPLFDIVERPAPASDVSGEAAWPVQIFPIKPPPFARQYFGEEDITNISKEAHDYVLREFKKHRSGPIFTPQSLAGTIELPGFHGGANWSGASFDPTTGTLYVNSNNVPWLNTLVEAPGKKCPYDHTGYFRFIDAEGYPAVKPPWGNLTAIDLNRGEHVWQITLGEFPELTARGVPPTGTENFGGSIVTGGGLVFIGATMDEKFHAFDKSTGKLLWDHKLDAGGYATPSTYSTGNRQFVVIAAGGGGKLRTKSGDEFVAFALPGR
ncbi:MAG TPA: pyrroloquinoline quinone-dependent dehydrogenase [Acidobacteriota bacterium]|jgi:quinoprotein glucose dehydrogenase